MIKIKEFNPEEFQRIIIVSYDNRNKYYFLIVFGICDFFFLNEMCFLNGNKRKKTFDVHLSPKCGSLTSQSVVFVYWLWSLLCVTFNVNKLFIFIINYELNTTWESCHIVIRSSGIYTVCGHRSQCVPHYQSASAFSCQPMSHKTMHNQVSDKPDTPGLSTVDNANDMFG